MTTYSALPVEAPAADVTVPTGRADGFFGGLAIVVLGTWFGGLAALILFVSYLFSTRRAVALDAAPLLFRSFERYQLAVAAVTLVTLVLWRLAGRRWTKTASLAMALLATTLSVLQIAYITPTITATQNTDRPRFDAFHHYASMNYTTIAVLVLIATVLALVAHRRAGRVAPEVA